MNIRFDNHILIAEYRIHRPCIEMLSLRFERDAARIGSGRIRRRKSCRISVTRFGGKSAVLRFGKISLPLFFNNFFIIDRNVFFRLPQIFELTFKIIDVKF